MNEKAELGRAVMLPKNPYAGVLGKIVNIVRSDYHHGYDTIEVEYPNGYHRTYWAYELQAIEEIDANH